MRVALTGATGIAGHAVALHLRSRGDEVLTLGRRPSTLGLPHVDWRFGERPDIACDALVHCAFAHVPGRYRGGEGDDPEGFMRLNRDGTRALFDAVKDARIVFVSSRAVYGAYPAGTRLTETLRPRPDTLYGELKATTERDVAERGGTSLRATGLYGPPPPGGHHKWAGLLDDFAAGRSIAPRAGTELHVADFAAAIALCLDTAAPKAVNASDLCLDRRDLLEIYADITGIRGILPERSGDRVSEMSVDMLRALGWEPGGVPRLRADLRELVLGAERSV
ncbi:nucleoside-diphosphate-sugar epimerase [Palleronia aestuarii]|uniref:Nucleoside-diphosphate-sugar epimerase n=1 Tax=Palleronia aestuarii TaxID=568105 RepID=A0A2W7N320_9RHOB|nr:NAD(P)-dependent oxidoreductase [Palleronia aestuarii]PZX14461.1 nucleoside-diphosphate-sugar epimerase [Palleronia aestuarii]